MKHLLLLLVSLSRFSDVIAQSVCEVCGPGFVITNDDVLVTNIGQEVPPTCAQLQDAGLNGDITDGQCALVPNFIFDSCGCQDASAATPSPAPVQSSTPAPTSATTTATTTPAPDNSVNPACNICGDPGMEITMPDALIDITGPEITCSELEQLGLDSEIPADQCPFIPLFAKSTCGCESTEDPTNPPVSSPGSGPEETNTCYVCGEGFEVGSPSAILDFIPGRELSCGELQDLGLDGRLAKGDCILVPRLISDVCNCVRQGSTPPPSPAPTSPPTLSPTITANPTNTPTCVIDIDAEGCRHEVPPEERNVTLLPSLAPSLPPGATVSPSEALAPTLVPTLAPTPSPITASGPSFTPTPAPAPGVTSQSAPPVAPTGSSGCEPSSTGSFGSNDGDRVEVQYLYEVLTTPATPSLAIENILSSTLEPALSGLLISGIFPELCTRRHRRRLNVVGITARPQDSLLEDVECVSAAEAVTCNVVQGSFTIFAENGTDVSESAQSAVNRIETAMTNGAFNNLDLRLEEVRYRTEPLPSGTDEPGENGDRSSAEPKSVPIWGWILIGVGIVLLNVIIFCICRRRRKKNDSSKGYEDSYGKDSYHSSYHTGSYGGAASYSASHSAAGSGSFPASGTGQEDLFQEAEVGYAPQALGDNYGDDMDGAQYMNQLNNS